MKVMISQPRYLPCLSFLRRIKTADILIILDNVQIDTRGFQNRNKVVSPGGLEWLTIPIEGSSRQIIKDISYDPSFKFDHINKIKEWYGDRKRFSQISTYWDAFCTNSYRSDVSISLVFALRLLGIHTPVVLASRLSSEINGSVDNLYRLFTRVDGTEYLTGPSYLDYAKEDNSFSHNQVPVLVDDWSPELYSEEYNYLGWVHYYLSCGKEFVKDQLI